MGRFLFGVSLASVVPLASLALGGCSSASSSGNDDPNGGALAGAGGGSAGHEATPGPSNADASGVDGPAPRSGAAGKAGADAFCSALCSHAQHCAAALDASAAALADCMTNCQSANEAPTTSPPTELLRADYVSGLAACIASSSCSDALQTSEADCAATLVSGSGDGGVPALVPTQAVAVFCHDLETSPCAGDAGVQDCVTEFLPYSDGALNAAIACFSAASCSTLASCYAAAFTQM